MKTCAVLAFAAGLAARAGAAYVPLECTALTAGPYKYSIPINDNVTFSYAVAPYGTGANAVDALWAQVKYLGNSWVGWALQPDVNGGMIGAMAVIGVPGGDVQEYNLAGKNVTDITASATQDLEASVLTPTATGTTLTFVRPLTSDNGDLTPDEVQKYLFAWGMDGATTLGYHLSKAGIQVTLQPNCTAAKYVPDTPTTATEDTGAAPTETMESGAVARGAFSGLAAAAAVALAALAL